jgi:hypothetical protein
MANINTIINFNFGFQNYVDIDSFKTNLNDFFANMMSIYGWTNLQQQQAFYETYLNLIINNSQQPIKLNQTAQYYNDLESYYSANANLTDAINWINNFVDLSINKLKVNENIFDPIDYYVNYARPGLTNPLTDLKTAVSQTGTDLKNLGSGALGFIGDSLKTLLSSILSQPIIIIGVVIFLIWKFK